MDIVIIGSGNAATILGRKFYAAGHRIVQVYSRNSSAATTLAYEWDAESTNYKSLLNKTAELYLVAVKDEAIKEVINDIFLPGKIVVHTAASVPKEVLKPVTEHYGVFYPLQTLRKDRTELPEIPIFIDASDEPTKRKLESLAYSIAADHVIAGNNDLLLKTHVAAVFVSNFTNHLYALAEDYCRKEGVDFSQLIPLIEETAMRLRSGSASQSQTGPAIRHDAGTIHKHLELLKDHPQLKNLYVLLTESIQQSK